MRHLTDVEIEARIATRCAALTTRVRRLEMAFDALLPALDLLAKDTPDPLVREVLNEVTALLGPRRM